MGNHEFCIRCHASDFHDNNECNPTARDRVEQEEAKREQYRNQLRVAAKKLQKTLEIQGYRVYNKDTYLEVWPITK